MSEKAGISGSPNMGSSPTHHSPCNKHSHAEFLWSLAILPPSWVSSSHAKGASRRFHSLRHRPLRTGYSLAKHHANGFLLEGLTEPQYKKIDFSNFCLNSESQKDNCFMTTCGNVVILENIATGIGRSVVLIGRVFRCRQFIHVSFEFP